VTQFEEPTGAVDESAAPAAEPAAASAPEPSGAPAAQSTAEVSSVAAALTELDTLPDRELAEHPEVYQRIHAELQSALATIDNA